MSKKATFERLDEIGADPAALDAILVTHEHSDHVSSIVPVARGVERQRKSRKVPIWMTHLTAPTIEWNGFEPELNEFQAGAGFTVGDIEVQSFTVPHDAVDPVGYSLRAGGLRLAVVTDLGYIPESVKYQVRDVDFLILESNHDIEMLKVGPYPWQVKQRVMSRKGHLSNDVASEFISTELSGSTRTLVLGHLSENNNHPEIVRMAARQALEGRSLTTTLVVAEPRCKTKLIEID